MMARMVFDPRFNGVVMLVAVILALAFVLPGCGRVEHDHDGPHGNHPKWRQAPERGPIRDEVAMVKIGDWFFIVG